MSRRHLTYAALLVTSIVLAACAQPMAPRSQDTGCTIIANNGSGIACDD